jgi:hypothetical protein
VRWMRPLAVLGCTLLVGSCAGLAMSTPTASPVATAAVTASPASPTPAPTAPAALVGSWVRTQSCEDQLAAFEAAGIATSHAEWVTGNWFDEDVSPPTSGNLCKGARPPVEHSHFFTADWGFGSRNEHGEVVDGGDFALVDATTLDFASHATEFGYDGTVLVTYSIDGDKASFEVMLPDGCTGTCLDAHAWAISAFYDADPWVRE